MEKNEHSFNNLGVQRSLLKVLAARQIIKPSPIQSQALPPIFKGQDCIGIAQTGSGKTLAFVLPMVEHLVKNRSSLALILAPTRELAMQIKEVCDWFKGTHQVYSSVIIGGENIGKQIRELRQRPQIMLATPGRLIDHLKQGTIRLERVDYLVLDEADRMFDMGFAPQLRQVFKYLPAKERRQTLLFSATMPAEITKLVMQHLREPIRIEIAAPGTVAQAVEQEIIILNNEDRKTALLELLKQTPEAVLIFTRTKFQTKKLTQWLRQQNYRAEELHGNRSLSQRIKAVEAIQSKKSRILIATDVASRGIDIRHLRLVINYDLPEDPQDYVHRIGRTGRAGEPGRAVSFVLTNQKNELRQIQRLIKTEIKETRLGSLPTVLLSNSSGAIKPKRRFRSRNFRRF